jgi:predicted MFS family arabinose efflux permease
VSAGSVRRTDESVLRDRDRRLAVVTLAAVLALDGADRTALGALAPSLKSEFGIGNTAIGLLASAFAVVGALAIVPIGVLTDRARRVTILVVCIASRASSDPRKRRACSSPSCACCRSWRRARSA